MVSVSPEKVATPPDAVTESVPPSVAPPGLLASATVTVPLKDESRLPELSSAWTVRPKGVPAVTLAGGCWVTTKLRRCSGCRRRSRWSPSSVNQRLPSGPVVIPLGPGSRVGDGVLGDGVGRRVDLTDLAGDRSVNQRLPSGPAVIPMGRNCRWRR